MEKAENGGVNTGGEKRVEQAERSTYRTPARVDGRLAGLRSAQRPSSALVRTGRAGAGTRGQEGEDPWGIPYTVFNQFKICCILATILYNTQIILFFLQPEIFHFMHLLTSSLLMNKPKMIILLSVFARACVLCKIN